MIRYIIRRLFWMIPVTLLIALVTFLLMHAAPGGPWDRDPSRRQVDARTQAVLNAQFGLDKPLWRQFSAYVIGDVDANGHWRFGAIGGNLGPSYRQRGRTVQDILFATPEGKSWRESRFGYSLRLAMVAFALSLLVGIPAGVVSALKHNTWVDYVSALIANVGVSVPNFVIGIFLIIILAVWLKLVPVVPRSWDSWGVWLAPALVMGFYSMAFTARLTRSSMLEVMGQDYVRTARAKGLSERRVTSQHMLRNAMIPVVTMLGPTLVSLITGSFVVETMFGFPGIGREYVTAISNRDYSMIMGTTLVYGVLVALANLSVDVLYGVLDPRIEVA
ncbi:MAG: ABC transporter permease [Anaerolineae bacterium]